jgi:hypothetical protein
VVSVIFFKKVDLSAILALPNSYPIPKWSGIIPAGVWHWANEVRRYFFLV